MRTLNPDTKTLAMSPFKDPAKRKAYQKSFGRKWYLANRDLVLTRKKARHAARSAKHYAAHREELLAKSHAAYFSQTHPPDPRWVAWQKTHVLLCDKFPEGRCQQAHTIHDLLDYDLPDDRHAFICLAKAYANAAALGTTVAGLDVMVKQQKYNAPME